MAKNFTDPVESSIYRDPHFYDLDYAGLVDDIPFYLEQCRQAKGPVLEIACGTGRLTIPLASHGIDITGLDLSAEMIEEGRRKANEAAVKLEWVTADCRNFDLNRTFHLVFIAFNSLQHLHDLASLEAFFAAVKRHLNPGGRFIVEVMNPSLEVLARKPDRRYYVGTFIDPKTGQDVLIEEIVDYDRATQVTNATWYYSIAGAPDKRTANLSLRSFFPEELDMLLQYNGFEILEKYGSHECTPFDSTSSTQIVVCQVDK